MRKASAGFQKNSDVYIEIEPAERLELEIHSTVIRQFGPQIRASLEDVLREMGVEAAKVTADDRGALDFVLRARMETAVMRSREP